MQSGTTLDTVEPGESFAQGEGNFFNTFLESTRSSVALCFLTQKLAFTPERGVQLSQIAGPLFSLAVVGVGGFVLVRGHLLGREVGRKNPGAGKGVHYVVSGFRIFSTLPFAAVLWVAGLNVFVNFATGKTLYTKSQFLLPREEIRFLENSNLLSSPLTLSFFHFSFFLYQAISDIHHAQVPRHIPPHSPQPSPHRLQVRALRWYSTERRP